MTLLADSSRFSPTTLTALLSLLAADCYPLTPLNAPGPQPRGRPHSRTRPRCNARVHPQCWSGRMPRSARRSCGSPRRSRGCQKKSSMSGEVSYNRWGSARPCTSRVLGSVYPTTGSRLCLSASQPVCLSASLSAVTLHGKNGVYTVYTIAMKARAPALRAARRVLGR